MTVMTSITAKLCALLLTAPVMAATHQWCGQIKPGQGLLQVSVGRKDVMCGWLQPQWDATYTFTASAAGTKVWLGKRLVTGPVQLKKDGLIAIVIEAPESNDFHLSWDIGLGVPQEIPSFALHQPTKTVRPGCEVPS